MVSSVVYHSSTLDYPIPLQDDSLGVYVERILGLRCGEWSYKQRGVLLANRSRQARTVTLTIRSTRPEYFDNLFEVMDADVEANMPATLIVDQWEAKVFVVKDIAKDISPTLCEATLTLLLLEGVWRKKHHYQFVMDQLVTSGLDYDTDFAFDYSRADVSSYVSMPDNRLHCSMDFIIYGPISNPRIQIGDNTYALDMNIYKGQRVEVDSLNCQVSLVHSNGQRENVLRYARFDKGMNIFQPLTASGVVIWNNAFNFDITVWDERGRAPWA